MCTSFDEGKIRHRFHFTDDLRDEEDYVGGFLDQENEGYAELVLSGKLDRKTGIRVTKAEATSDGLRFVEFELV
jgi:hypothetical protein